MKKWLWLIPVVLLLLAAYIVLDAPLEKQSINPVSENVEALEFSFTDGSETVRLDDPEALAKLRRAYRWTNYHMYCCLGDGEVYAYVYPVIDDRTDLMEPVKLYNSWQIPGFNLSFRLLLRKYCDDLLDN